MAGNVWEWVSDWYDKFYYGKSPLSNPLGPDSGGYHILRGGSWYISNVNSVNRAREGHINPNNSVIGFRCARSAK
jgi:formylglycine-generating enzyme required for sulfatase activity